MGATRGVSFRKSYEVDMGLGLNLFLTEGGFLELIFQIKHQTPFFSPVNSKMHRLNMLSIQDRTED